MAADSKALLVCSKALPDTTCENYDKAMLSTSERMAEKLKRALKARGMGQAAFAEKCGVSKQAVQSWVKTGRIDKKHLPKFAEILGYELSWWLDTEDPAHSPWAATTTIASKAHDREGPYQLSNWPFASISQSDYARLTDRQKGMVEGYINALLTDVLPSKRNGTSDA